MVEVVEVNVCGEGQCILVTLLTAHLCYYRQDSQESRSVLPEEIDNILGYPSALFHLKT